MSSKIKPVSMLLHLLLILNLNLAALTTGDNHGQFVYSGFSDNDLVVDGTSTITSNGLLELTNGTNQQKGHAFYPTPLQFVRSPNGTVQSFSTSFVFAILSVYTDLSAHGMAFVVAPSRNFSAAMPEQFLGLTNIQNNGNVSNHFFAVELDTIQNKEFNDLNANHAGANVNGLKSLKSYYAGYYADEDGNFRNLSLISRDAMQVWIDYDHKVSSITVTMAPLKVTRPTKPLFMATYNLTGVVTDVAYIGFSAATGTIDVRHYVLGWSFSMNGTAPTIDTARLPKLPRVGPKPRSKLMEIVLPIATASFVLIVGTVVFLLIRRHLKYAELREDWEVEFGPHRFSYKDLFYATEGFKEKHLLGIGGFGRVMQYLDSEMVLPEMSPADMRFHMMAIMQNEGFDDYITGSTASTASDDQFVYNGFAGVNLTLDGNALVTPDGLLELTNDTVNLGHAFYPTPLNFHQQHNGTVPSFSVSFVFVILSVHADISADGMAFFVAPTKNLSNTWAQYIGLLNSGNDGNASNHMFAVELDTTQNTEFKDIHNNHVGININSLTSLQAHHTGYYEDKSGFFNNLTLISGKAMQVWADYDGETTRIDVTLAPLGKSKPVRPLLSVIYNLSLILNDKSYIGFSATTGAISTRHCVLGWSFAMNGSAPPIDISKLPKLPRLGPKPRSKVLEITLPIATAAFVLTVGLVVVLLVYRRLRYKEVKEDWEVDFGPHRFSFKDLFHATRGFRRKNLLGAGGFGKVYKGVLPKSKVEVAAKRVSHESRQGMKEFIAEVASIGRLRHRNIVPLLGYCRRQGELLLVYDYMSNGSLNNYLYHEDGQPTLCWARRFHIIKGVAAGLFYLHEKWEKVVVHRDIKPSNILLDNEMNGRIGDFGLSRLYDHGTDPQTTHMVGTMGYLAPELVRSAQDPPCGK
nr:unnamed protein product [Digitaria exilis]